MRSRLWACSWAALLISALALSGCGANPPAQAEPARQAGVVLPSPPPMPTSLPLPPTATVPPAPAAVAPAVSTTLLATDFATIDLGRWTVIDAADALAGPSVWKIQDGRLIPYSDAQDLPAMYTTALVGGDPAWKDYSVSAAAYTTNSDEFGVVARASAAGYYVFKLFPAAQQPAMALLRYDAAKGIHKVLATTNTGGFAREQWYTLRLQVQGQTLTAFVEGKPVLRAQDPTLTAGRAGVAAYAGGDVEFDNLAVLALAPQGQQ